jgi:hypothetical protein
MSTGAWQVDPTNPQVRLLGADRMVEKWLEDIALQPLLPGRDQLS